MFDPFSLLQDQFTRNQEPLDWSDGLLRTPGPGHTREVHELSAKHDGRHSANYYTASALYGGLDPKRGLGLLQELAKLQVSDRAHPQLGGFRWYREETKIADTNGAFFVMQPLVVLCLLHPDKIPADHRKVLDSMMRLALHWFAEECANPSLYYPNKIMSDGALLLGMAAVFDDAPSLEAGIAFWQRWEEYTQRRGWGWGENISFGYLSIIAGALQISRLVLEKREPALAAKLKKRLLDIFELVRFHGGKEFVPTIRSYNYLGNETVFGWLQTVARTREDERDLLGEVLLGAGPVNYGAIVGIHLFQDFLVESLKLPLPAPIHKPCTRRDRLFDNTFASTWMGKHLRLGSVNQYPNIPGCYQHPTWGLGWQSMPLNFLVEGHQVGFARMYATVAGKTRCHPGMGHHASYLSPALFTETTLPELRTQSSQQGPAVLALRSISGLCNAASELQDTWVINRFQGEVYTLDVPSGPGSVQAVQMKNDNAVFQSGSQQTPERQWVILAYPQATLAFSALSTLAVGDTAPRAGAVSFDQAEGVLHLRQFLYRGEETLLRQDRIEAGWVILAFDAARSRAEITAELAQVVLSDLAVPDFEVPRDGFTLQRKVRLTHGSTAVGLDFDPLYL